MNNSINYISFRPDDAKLTGCLRFAITKRAFEDIRKEVADPIEYFKNFSRQDTLLIIPKQQDVSKCNIFTSHYTISIIINSRDEATPQSLLIAGFQKNTLEMQNNAIKYGICVKLEQSILIQVSMSQPINIFCDIKNGKLTPDNSYKNTDMSAAILELQNIISEISLSRNNPQIAEGASENDIKQPEQLNPRLQNMLQIAENYAILSNSMEEKKAIEIGNIAYLSITSLEYKRNDREMYQLTISTDPPLDESVFKVGTKIEVLNKKDEIYTAEIIELEKEDQDAPATALNVLFSIDANISIDDSLGYFRLPVSTVNRDVQLAAIEKIRAGEAKSTYMNQVFSPDYVSCFDNNDLSDIENTLNQKKYPPNDSQKNAIFQGINSKDVFLVMGPPGTGKTTVILEWVKYYVSIGKRVLVTSQNNKAVDNVLARLAEEKINGFGIDMLRIGSESKMQADVTPFMFEKRIEALRKNISDTCDNRIDSLKIMIYEWGQYYDSLNNLIQEMKDEDEARACFQNSVQSRLLPSYQELKTYVMEYNSNLCEKQKIIENIWIRFHKIQAREQSSNKLFRFFTYLPSKRNRRLLSKYFKTYRNMKQQEQIIVDLYNRKKSLYDRVLEQVYSGEYRTLLEKKHKAEDQKQIVSLYPKQNANNIWDLFEECRNVKINTLEECYIQKERLSQNIVRANNLQEIISEWNDQIANVQNYALNEIVMESTTLVGATCIGINSQKRFANLDFDVTIMDEAGQIQVHNALVPMSVSNKIIMLGDHKQIPPTVDSDLVDLCVENDVPTDLLYKSLFEQMYYDLPEENKIMLDTQYRMPAEIANTISEWFYDGKYYSPSFKENLKGKLVKLSERPYIIIDTSDEPNRREHKIEGAGCDNELEATIIKQIIRSCVDEQLGLSEIGVISAYKSQVKKIKQKLNEFLPKEIVNEMVATLDSYQGQERDIILYSFTKSNTKAPENVRIGFLNELRRLNVAMTRCKKTLVLIGDMRFLSECRHFDETKDGSELQFSEFINKMIKDVKTGRGEYLSYKQFLERMSR